MRNSYLMRTLTVQTDVPRIRCTSYSNSFRIMTKITTSSEKFRYEQIREMVLDRKRAIKIKIYTVGLFLLIHNKAENRAKLHVSGSVSAMNYT